MNTFDCGELVTEFSRLGLEIDDRGAGVYYIRFPYKNYWDSVDPSEPVRQRTQWYIKLTRERMSLECGPYSPGETYDSVASALAGLTHRMLKDRDKHLDALVRDQQSAHESLAALVDRVKKAGLRAERVWSDWSGVTIIDSEQSS